MAKTDLENIIFWPTQGRFQSKNGDLGEIFEFFFLNFDVVTYYRPPLIQCYWESANIQDGDTREPYATAREDRI